MESTKIWVTFISEQIDSIENNICFREQYRLIMNYREKKFQKERQQKNLFSSTFSQIEKLMKTKD